jgi:transposase
MVDIENDPIFAELLVFVDSIHPAARNRKVSNATILKAILHVLLCNTMWKTLSTVDVKWQAIYKHHIQLSKAQAFTDLLQTLVRKYLLQYEEEADLFIQDCTLVKNDGGQDGTGPNHFDRSREATKVAMITSRTGIPLACTFHPGNLHDVQTVDPLLEELANVKPTDRASTIICDAGYVMNTEKKSTIERKHNVKIIHPYRRNMRQQLTREESNLVNRNRSKIENTFCRLDKFPRLRSRKDHKIINFKNFHSLGTCLLVLEKLLFQKIGPLRESITRLIHFIP